MSFGRSAQATLYTPAQALGQLVNWQDFGLGKGLRWQETGADRFSLYVSPSRISAENPFALSTGQGSSAGSVLSGIGDAAYAAASQGAKAVKEGYQWLEKQLDVQVVDRLANAIEVVTDSGFSLLRQVLPKNGNSQVFVNIAQQALKRRLQDLGQELASRGVKRLILLAGKGAVRTMTVAGWVCLGISVAAFIIEMVWGIDIGKKLMTFLEANAPIVVPAAKAVGWLFF